MLKKATPLFETIATTFKLEKIEKKKKKKGDDDGQKTENAFAYRFFSQSSVIFGFFNFFITSTDEAPPAKKAREEYKIGTQDPIEDFKKWLDATNGQQISEGWYGSFFNKKCLNI